MHVAVTGATGLLGRASCAALRARGDRVTTIGRDDRSDVRWDPDAGVVDGDVLAEADAVVHLAGESLGGQRWTVEQKDRILRSRVAGTRLVAAALAQPAARARVLLSASAVGYYGDRGDEVLTEASARPSARGFLSDVCRAWEDATEAAERAGIRTVHLRTGMVLSADGGALAGMLPPFRAGLGGYVGTGRQYVSWISITDTVGAMLHALDTDAIRGALNVTGPEPVTNATLCAALGSAVGRPATTPIPTPVLEEVYGAELVRQVFVEGQRAVPARLQATGYRFRHATVTEAVRSALA
jgi:uncharacterized protein (TIGR01777 family)